MLRAVWIGSFLLLFGLAGSAMAMPTGLASYYAVMGNEKGSGMVLEMRDCDGDRLCGRLVSLGSLPARDTHNPTKSERSRALCGLDILTVATDGDAVPGTLKGSFYDPRTGDVNTVSVTLDPNHRLHIRGHAGQAVFSRSYALTGEIWNPLPTVQQACDSTARPVS